MIRLFSAISLTAASLLALATPALAEERAFPVGSFDKLAAAGSADITVTTGRAPGVHATGSVEALDRLDIHVDGDTLKVGNKRESNWSWHDYGRVHIAITVPMLRAVDVAGSGGTVVDRVKARDFAAAVSGSGSVRIAALDAETSSFAISGSGTIEAAGHCGTGSAKIAGSGAIKIAGLKCATLSASVAGSGKIDAFASQTATLSTMGSGDIDVTGGARCTTSTAGSGKARCS